MRDLLDEDVALALATDSLVSGDSCIAEPAVGTAIGSDHRIKQVVRKSSNAAATALSALANSSVGDYARPLFSAFRREERRSHPANNYCQQNIHITAQLIMFTALFLPSIIPASMIPLLRVLHRNW